MIADAAHQAANMAAHFLPGRRLARPQQDRHRARGRGIVDMDRQKAALVVVRVEQGKLLIPPLAFLRLRRKNLGQLRPCTTSTVSSMSSVTAAGGRR
jgi:hypothetical protein